MAVISKHRNNNIVLYERHDSPFIFCRLKIPESDWIRKSTYKRTVTDALSQAEEWYDEMIFLHGRGMPVKRRTFTSVCDLYLKELGDEVTLGNKNERNLKDYKMTVDRYLRPFFGRKFIDLISSKDTSDYHIWRAQYYISGEGSKKKFITYMRGDKKIKRPSPKGRPPSQTTRNKENVVLRAIFKTGIRHDVLSEMQMPNITISKSNRGTKNRRPAFTKEEYDKLIQFLFYWRDEENCTNAERRWLLKLYVTVLVHTGIRPGTEADNIRWKDLKEVKTTKGKERYVINVNGKTGSRNPVASGPAYDAIYQIKTDLMHAGTEITPDLPLFCLPNGEHVKNDYFRQLFTKALKKSDLLKDNDGQQRSLYSLRHSYATNQLLYGKVDIYLLAKQLGTSIQMIEQHYGHLTPELALDELTDTSVDDFIL